MLRTAFLFFLFWKVFELSLSAQDVYLPFRVEKLPIEFKYEQSFPPKEVKKYTYIASDGQSEFYIKITRISPDFNADSLKAMFFKLYDDPQIKNLQVRELGEAVLGGKKVFKCVLAFMAADKWYLSTIYMVPFYINARYNSLLFYFEMGEMRAPSYAMIQEKMIETLRYTDFSFTDLKDEKWPYSLCKPEVWSHSFDAESRSLTLTDDRAHLILQPMASSDTLSPGKLADLEKEKMKNDPRYAATKIKTSTEKIGKTTLGKVLYSHDEPRGRKTVRMLHTLWLVPVPGLDGVPGFRLTFSCPEETAAHYEALLIKILKCWDIQGHKPFADL
ncbi:MAG: hypothetical protein NZM15_06145 [Flavobacteriales bacterium]|nr:hypothetical protein [Flavobacteriales bacterium]MDW8432265.1 hypothetical protein [Flavobacteriales bacterium]